jgi:hypothetical protein
MMVNVAEECLSNYNFIKFASNFKFIFTERGFVHKQKNKRRKDARSPRYKMTSTAEVDRNSKIGSVTKLRQTETPFQQNDNCKI